VVLLREKRNAYRELLEKKVHTRDYMEVIGVDRNLKETDVKVWTGYILLKIGKNAGLL